MNFNSVTWTLAELVLIFAASIGFVFAEQQERHRLADALLSELTCDLADVSSSRDGLAIERDEMQHEIAELRAGLLAAGANSEESRVALAEIDRLKQQLEDDRLTMDGLHAVVDALRNSEAEARALVARVEAERQRLLAERSRLAEEVELLLAESHSTRQTLTHLQDDNRTLDEIIGQLRAAASEARTSELVLRRELLDIAGDTKSVLFLFDASKSIRMSGRWDEAIALAQRWVEYLGVERCDVIAWGSTVKTFGDGALVDVSGEDGANRLAAMLKWLGAQKPQGRTDLRAALEFAYDYEDVDSIVLVTDGGPLGARDRVTRLVAQRAASSELTIPINVIAIGSYQPQAIRLMRDVASLSGGSFRGR